MSPTRADRGKSGSLAGQLLCMVMHIGNGGGSRTWQGLLGRRPDWESPTPVTDPHLNIAGLRARATTVPQLGLLLRT
jgi:hypothetical protein